MKVQTQFFGAMEVNQENIIRFPSGLLGFANFQNFFLVECSEEPLFMWLQSLDDPKTAFTVLESQFFTKDYHITLYPQDLAELEIDHEKNGKALNILTMESGQGEVTINLKAPIILNLQKRIGKQVILTDSRYQVNHPIFKQLQVLRSFFHEQKAPEQEAHWGFNFANLEQFGQRQTPGQIPVPLVEQ